MTGNLAGPEQLLDEARARTGLDNFGEESFLEGLEVLVRSLQQEATLNAVGELVLPELIVGHLCHRLEIEDWYRRHPDIDDVAVTAPLFGLGLPRTGSTALSILLAEDPNARSLRRWEAANPCPPPSTVSGPDPRIAEAEASEAMRNAMAPRLAALVPGTATGPEECQDLMALDFKSHYFQAFAYVPTYSDWLLDADLTSTYRYERRVLKLLAWGEPARPWRLKCPSHLLWLGALDAVFPDARYVMTHRDPTEVMVSVADLYAEVSAQFSEGMDPRYLGRLNVKHWTAAMDRVLAFRERHGGERFYDIDFRAVQDDPLGAVRGLYAWLGEPVSYEFATGMARWWADNAAAREANLHPDPAVFGLDLEALRTQFAPYTAMIAGWTSAPTPARRGAGRGNAGNAGDAF